MGSARPRRSAPRRRMQVVVGLACVALTALVCIDCLNLIQSEAWTDLTRSPHLAAVHRVKDAHGQDVLWRVAAPPQATTLPAPVEVLCVWFVLALLLEVARSFRDLPGVRQPSRAPPALRFSSSARR